MSQTKDDVAAKLREAINECCEWDGERWVLLDGCDPADSVLSLLVEDACAGAVVEPLIAQTKIYKHRSTTTPVPIASVGPFGWLARDVAKRLVEHNDPDRLAGLRLLGLPAEPFPFAAAYSEHAADGGRRVRRYVLVAASCPSCGGWGKHSQSAYDTCEACKGTCKAVDVYAIAKRYGAPGYGEEGQKDITCAVFEVEAS